MNKPEVICLCGSTRFADWHTVRRWELERTGQAICLMINYLPGWYTAQQQWDGHDHFGEAAGVKDALDMLHLHKIDLADRVEVIALGGYYGDSTAAEIAYAKNHGKPVSFWEPTLEAIQAAEAAGGKVNAD